MGQKNGQIKRLSYYSVSHYPGSPVAKYTVLYAYLPASLISTRAGKSGLVGRREGRKEGKQDGWMDGVGKSGQRMKGSQSTRFINP